MRTDQRFTFTCFNIRSEDKRGPCMIGCASIPVARMLQKLHAAGGTTEFKLPLTDSKKTVGQVCLKAQRCAAPEISDNIPTYEKAKRNSLWEV
mmetsp:Transcript_43370/g.67947  ORF Transcript_43370/g.67947 Transcript_43370/m.67947 type:complete len:93 (+) Transcript_43370:127-405(+)